MQPMMPPPPMTPPPALPGKKMPAIVNITKVGGGYLVTLADGQELKIKPGDAHHVGPLDRKTTFDAQDGHGPTNLHKAYHVGALPADLHQMIQVPQGPSAAHLGMTPRPMLPGMPPPPMGGPPMAGRPPMPPPRPPMPGMPPQGAMPMRPPMRPPMGGPPPMGAMPPPPGGMPPRPMLPGMGGR